MYIIGFSGPPRSGKDSLATMLAAHIEDTRSVQPQILSLSQPMREVTFALAGLDYSIPEYERIKDSVDTTLQTTIRAAMIALSEEFVKPRLGHDFWARSLVRRLWQPAPQILIVPDMGFDAERIYFEQLVGVNNCVWVQVSRPGCDFSKDSRSYIGEGDRVTQIYNDTDGHEYVLAEAVRLYSRLLNRFGWVF